MLTPQHLTLIRAALQYLAEELVPHGRQALQPYFEEPLTDDLTAEDVHHLRRQLQDGHLKYVVCDRAGECLLEPSLIADLTSAQRQAAAVNGRLGSVLLSPGD